MTNQPTAYLLAGSVQMGARVALAIFGCTAENIAESRFKAPNGELIRVLADMNGANFYGLPIGAKIYLASGWEHRGDAKMVRNRLDAGRFVAGKVPELADYAPA